MECEISRNITFSLLLDKKMLKSSNYNFEFGFVKNKDSILYYNAISDALIELDKKYIQYFNLSNRAIEFKDDDLNEEHKAIIEQLKKGNFLIDSRIDERQFLRYLSNLSKYSSKVTSFTILPTLECNFGCSYCYEEHRNGQMSQEVQNKIIEIIEKRIQNNTKSVFIEWYGGEPLLYPDIIKNISERVVVLTEKNGVNFSAEMVSNGYLINDNILKLLQDCKINKMQITLDGPPMIHDKKRKLKAGNKTFWTILENIKNASKYFTIALRINVDKKNLDSIYQLLDILCENKMNNENIYPYLGLVRPSTKACKNYSSFCLSEEEYAINNAKFIEELHKRNFKNFTYPQPGYRICGAVTEGIFGIDPDGNLYKCWETVAVPEEAVGNILKVEPDVDYNLNLIKWMTYDPFENEECKECKIFPICFGGCPSSRVYHPEGKISNDVMCSPMKYNAYLSKIMEIAQLKHARGDFKQNQEKDKTAK